MSKTTITSHEETQSGMDSGAGYGRVYLGVAHVRDKAQRERWVQKQRACEAGIRQMARTLDEMSRPLEVLQYRLELGRAAGTEDACREAVLTGLNDFERVGEALAWMRQLVRQVMVEINAEELGRMQA